MVRDIVAVVAQGVDTQDAADKLRSFLVHGVDVKLHQQTFLALGVALGPHVTHGQVYQEVVVGLTPLQKTLAALDIIHQIGGITPDAVVGGHVNRGIETPSWPGIVFRRVAGAVEKDMVYTAGEHQVEVGLHLREGGAEMLSQPGEGLTGGVSFAHYVGGRRRIFQHRHVAVVLTGETGVGAQTLDAEF